MKTPRLIWTLILSLAVSMVLHAAEPAHRVMSDVAYLPPERDEKLDLYVPNGVKAGSKAPAVVWVHGGGWMRGDKAETSAKEICTTLANAGYVVASINYRIGAGSWPTNLRDAKNAVRFLRSKASDYGIDPDRIAIGGGSAGAHLAMMVAFTAGRVEFDPPRYVEQPYDGVSSAVSCVLNLSGPTALATREAVDADGKPTGKRRQPANSMEAFGATVSYSGGTVEFFVAASPVTYVKAKSPPVLILQGNRDSEVDPNQPKTLAAVLTQHHVPFEMKIIDGAGHGFDLESWRGQPLKEDLRPVALAFLAKHLGAPAKK
jgi:acetyl esterase/lipase